MSNELLSLAVAGLNCDDQALKDIARSLVTLIRYHNTRLQREALALAEVLDSAQSVEVSINESEVWPMADKVNGYNLKIHCPDCHNDSACQVFRGDSIVAKRAALILGRPFVVSAWYALVQLCGEEMAALIGPEPNPQAMLAKIGLNTETPKFQELLETIERDQIVLREAEQN